MVIDRKDIKENTWDLKYIYENDNLIEKLY